MFNAHSPTQDLLAAVAEMKPLDAIDTLLNAASILADREAADEQHASDPFTFLAQLIDTAQANAQRLQEEGR